MRKIWLGLLFACTNMYAQSNVGQKISITIPSMASIRIKPGSKVSNSIDFKNANELTNGISNNNAILLQVSSNMDWKVFAQSKASKFQYIGSHFDPKMPSSLLQLRNNKFESYQFLQDTPQLIANGKRGGFSNANEFAIDFKAIPGTDFPEGEYLIDLVYTLTTE